MPDGRLAGAGLADEAEHLAGRDLERDLVDDVGARPMSSTRRSRTSTARRGSSVPLPSRPIAARAMPSVTRLVPTVSRPMASTGSSTAHGWTVIESRFSLIISPQSAVGGCRPKPRKLIAATSPIEYVMRRPSSTSSGLVTLGSSSPKMIRERFSPTASAALTKSRSTTSWAAPRITRATRGACVRPTISTISHSFGAERRDGQQHEDDLRERQQHVVAAHEHVVEPVARVGGDEADDHAEDDAEQRSPRPTSTARSGRRAGSGSRRRGRARRRRTAPRTTARCSGRRRTRSASAARRAARTRRRARSARRSPAPIRVRAIRSARAGCRATGAAAGRRRRRRAVTAPSSPRSTALSTVCWLIASPSSAAA